MIRLLIECMFIDRPWHHMHCNLPASSLAHPGTALLLKNSLNVIPAVLRIWCQGSSTT
ncbi:hypothetical protein GALMADRAFT_799462 [Galerina marginata CBS 339.88]|uniref:Uncharacterized protein n=1 Tax=Galerina marginata (strain CBS 339.88) TaxID=685588 RepID=A0A067SUH0_GALM3|nr:hypothetical protein GALMADRAFT_799462 [Galerina marginata CBS 339.88]